MKKLLFIFLILVLLFGCTQINQNNTESFVENNEENNQNLVDENNVVEEEIDYQKEFKENVCYYNTNFFNYKKINNISEIVEKSSEDFNKSGLCNSNSCWQHIEYDINIIEDRMFFTIEEHFYANTGDKEQLTSFSIIAPKYIENFKVFYNGKEYKQKSTKSLELEEEQILVFDKLEELTNFETYFDVKPGKNIIRYTFDFEFAKTCKEGVCILPVNTFAYDYQTIKININSDKKILNNYQKEGIGSVTQLIAISDEDTFNVGKLVFSEKQRKYYTANKVRIDWVADRINYAENIVGQKTPENIFIFFTNSVRSETSFTYKNSGLIILQGDSFDDYFEETLLHEINHQAVNNPFWPNWLDEGIAQYLGRKYSGEEITGEENENYIVSENEINYYLSDYSWESYEYAASIIEMFITNYGCEKFNKFLFELNKLSTDYEKEREVIENALKKSIGGDYTYEDLINKKFVDLEVKIESSENI